MVRTCCWGGLDLHISTLQGWFHQSEQFCWVRYSTLELWVICGASRAKESTMKMLLKWVCVCKRESKQARSIRGDVSRPLTFKICWSNHTQEWFCIPHEPFGQNLFHPSLFATWIIWNAGGGQLLRRASVSEPVLKAARQVQTDVSSVQLQSTPTRFLILLDFQLSWQQPCSGVVNKSASHQENLVKDACCSTRSNHRGRQTSKPQRRTVL